jgi:lipid-binding SYLF domain-containing protein
MKTKFNLIFFMLSITLCCGMLAFSQALLAASAEEIDAKVNSALQLFYEKVGPAKELSGKAKGILVFPDVIKAGFGIGGEYGEGALRIGGLLSSIIQTFRTTTTTVISSCCKAPA